MMEKGRWHRERSNNEGKRWYEKRWIKTLKNGKGESRMWVEERVWEGHKRERWEHQGIKIR